MRRFVFLLFGLVAAPALGGTETPVVWTADGRWFAYTVAVPANRAVPEPGWIFGTTPPAAKSDGPLRYRLLATDAANGSTIVLEDGEKPLTSPVWSPDGHMIAFGRRVAERGPAPSRFEIVIQDGLNHQRVLLSRPEVADDAQAQPTPSRSLSWSPDGRYLAVPAAGAWTGACSRRSRRTTGWS